MANLNLGPLSNCWQLAAFHINSPIGLLVLVNNELLQDNLCRTEKYANITPPKWILYNNLKTLSKLDMIPSWFEIVDDPPLGALLWNMGQNQPWEGWDLVLFKVKVEKVSQTCSGMFKKNSFLAALVIILYATTII